MKNKMTEEDCKIIYKRFFKNLAKTPYIIINISKAKNSNAIIEIGKKDQMNNSQAPKWFQDFEKRNDKRWEEQKEFNKNQTEFNKYIINRLDGIDSRLDNVEKDIVEFKHEMKEHVSEFKEFKHKIESCPTIQKELIATK